MVLFCYIMTVSIKNIGDAITIAGGTVNPLIGFIYPILFYLKLDSAPFVSPKKIFAFTVMMFILGVSVIGLTTFFVEKFYQNE